MFASVVVFVVLRTRLGLSLRALRDDEDTAQEIGVSTFRTKLWVWVLSSFLIGMVGALEAVAPSDRDARRGVLAITWTINIVSDHYRRRRRHDRRAQSSARASRSGSGETSPTTLSSTSLITGVIVILIIRFAPAGHLGDRQGDRGGYVGQEARRAGEDGGAKRRHELTADAAALPRTAPRLTARAG